MIAFGWCENSTGSDITKRSVCCILECGWRYDNLEDLDVDGRIVLKWILGKLVVRMWAAFIWLRIGPSGGLL
jgi:hypothetical protein